MKTERKLEIAQEIVDTFIKLGVTKVGTTRSDTITTLQFIVKDTESTEYDADTIYLEIHVDGVVVYIENHHRMLGSLK